jgi:hypothetical protein
MLLKSWAEGTQVRPNNTQWLPISGGFRTYPLPIRVFSCELVNNTTHYTCLSCMMMIHVFPLALKMGDDRRRAMYDWFNNDTLGYSDARVKVADEFVARAFGEEPRVAKCPCTRCWNLNRLNKFDLSIHICDMSLTRLSGVVCAWRGGWSSRVEHRRGCRLNGRHARWHLAWVSYFGDQ